MHHKEGSFKGLKDFNIYCQCWLPDGKARAVLLVAHGFAEHSGRYGNLVNYFVPRGYAMYALDHRGHGRSDGERVKVDDFYDYVKDLHTFFKIAHRENPRVKVFLIGHSMGSVISLFYAREYQQDLAGLVTSGGVILKPGEALPSQSPSPVISRDPAIVAAYESDPLIYRGPIPPDFDLGGLLVGLYDIIPRINLPVLIMAGNGCPDGARSHVLFERIGSRDRTLKLYKNLLHEIFNEPEHPRVLADLEAWVAARL